MRLARADVAVGAYVHDTRDGSLHRIADVPSSNGRTQVALEDVRQPLTSERLPDPQAPGRLGASMTLQPAVHLVPLIDARRCFELVVPAPSAEETASEAEFGAMGTAPE